LGQEQKVLAPIWHRPLSRLAASSRPFGFSGFLLRAAFPLDRKKHLLLTCGGTILRDLFTEDRGGYFEDVALLDMLVVAKLGREANALMEAEGDVARTVIS
jgi:hypothetical protein